MTRLRKPFFAIVLCLLAFTAACPAIASAADTTLLTVSLPQGAVCRSGDTLVFSGTNSVSDTTYFFITGPKLDRSGSQAMSADPYNAPVIDGDASTFASAAVGAEDRWSWTFDSGRTGLEPGTYTLYAVSSPRDKANISSAAYDTGTFIVIREDDAPEVPATGSAGDGTSVTITSPHDGKYTYGDTITFSGTNTASGITYLFVTGPNLKAKGSQIQSIHPRDSPVLDDDASTFAAAAVVPGGTWSWTWKTDGVFIDSGAYTVYAAAAPRDLPHLTGTSSDRVAFIVRRPGSLSARIDTSAQQGNGAVPVAESLPQPSVMMSGNLIVVSGVARNNPSAEIGIWIIGEPVNGNFAAAYADHFVTRTDAAGSYTLTADTKGTVEDGRYYVVVQHPMVNDILDISVEDDPSGAQGDRWVINKIIAMAKGTGSSRLFKFGGNNKLVGADAYEALVTALSDPMVDDRFVTYPAQTATPVSSVTAQSSAAGTTTSINQGTIMETPGRVPGGTDQTPAGSGSMLDNVFLFLSGLF